MFSFISLNSNSWHNFEFTNLWNCRWKKPITCLLFKYQHIIGYYLTKETCDWSFLAATNQFEHSQLCHPKGCRIYKDIITVRGKLSSIYLANMELIYWFIVILEHCIKFNLFQIFASSYFYNIYKENLNYILSMDTGMEQWAKINIFYNFLVRPVNG